MPAEKKNLLVIEHNTLKAMMADPTITKILPCLVSAKVTMESVQAGKKNCNSCAAKKKKIAQTGIKQAYMCIRGARGATLTQLKKVLNAKKIRIISRNARGAKVQYTL